MTVAAALLLIGRVILGLFFVVTGIRNISGFVRQPASRWPETNYGFALPAPVTALGFAAQLLGGLSVMFGIFPGWGAALLILFLIGATGLFHNFVRFEGEARRPHLYFALVNTALCGYCLTIAGISQ